jgi:ankyrin repeat protein
VTLNSRDHQNRTALSHAAEKGHFQAVKLLLETGADVTIYDNEFRTPFHWAFKCGHREIASILARCPSPISSVESLSSEESLQCEESLSSDGSGTNHFGSSCEGRIPSLEEIFE